LSILIILGEEYHYAIFSILLSPHPSSAQISINIDRFGCKECQQIFVPSAHFLILERANNDSGLSQANKLDDPFLKWISYIGTRKILMQHVWKHCHGGESTCHSRVRFFSSEQIPILNSSAINLAPNL
jgi:hypothetical protein